MGNILSRDDILHAQDLPVERVDVSEWGGSVLVKGLTGAEREQLESAMFRDRKRDDNHARAILVALSAVDEAGNKLFTLEDVEALAEKSGAALNRVFAVAQRLSGLGRAQAEAEKN